jgi:hypothetical protein
MKEGIKGCPMHKLCSRGVPWHSHSQGFVHLPPALQVKQLMKNSSSWRGGFCIFLLIITAVVLLILTTKIGRVFGH